MVVGVVIHPEGAAEHLAFICDVALRVVAGLDVQQRVSFVSGHAAVVHTEGVVVAAKSKGVACR